MSNENVLAKIVVDGWQAQLKPTNELFEKLSDVQLMQEIAPGRNRGIYLLGHMIAVHDLMLPLLRFEEALYPALKPVFIDEADKAVNTLPPVKELREQWKTVNDKLLNHIKNLPAEEWFTRHANISPEDFVKEPHRNRLSVLLSRNAHMSYHRGQMILLKERD